jgi:hypothetical protein
MNLPTAAMTLTLTATVLCAGPDAAILGRPLLTVRTYQVARLQPGNWAAVIRETTRILDRAGIDIAWVHCTPHNSPEAELPARCATPYQPNEVAVRIIRQRSSTRADTLPLGDSLVDSATHSGTLATVYLDHVERLARQADVSANIVMARAIAHELGHLLLGTSSHSVRGLMRPVWTAEELARNQPADWTIAADDGERMRRAFGRRLEGSVSWRRDR